MSRDRSAVTARKLGEISRALVKLSEQVAALAEAVEHEKPARADAVLAIPFYFVKHPRRGAITRKVFAHYRRVADELGMTVIGVGSEGARSRAVFAEQFDLANYIEYPQTWSAVGAAGSVGLRAKFDATVRACQAFDPKRVFIIGSDDVIGAEFFRRAIDSTADVVGIGSGPEGGARIVRIPGQRIVEWDGRYEWAPDVQFCGGGLGLSRRVLDRWRWAPFVVEGDEIGIERRARAERGVTLEALYPRRDGFDFYAVKADGAVLNGWANVERVGARKASRLVHDEFAALWASL